MENEENVHPKTKNFDEFRWKSHSHKTLYDDILLCFDLVKRENPRNTQTFPIQTLETDKHLLLFITCHYAKQELVSRISSKADFHAFYLNSQRWKCVAQWKSIKCYHRYWLCALSLSLRYRNARSHHMFIVQVSFDDKHAHAHTRTHTSAAAVVPNTRIVLVIMKSIMACSMIQYTGPTSESITRSRHKHDDINGKCMRGWTKRRTIAIKYTK